MKAAVCTIISRNYLPYARVLARSFRSFHADCDFFVLMVDGPDTGDKSEPFDVINVTDLNIQNLRFVTFRYNKLELNTNVKPTFLAHLFAEKGVEKLLYLDPDILIYDTLGPLFDLLDHYNILLTPHCTAPVPDDGKRPSEIDFLSAGVFNLGFLGLRRSEQTDDFLSWWENRCLKWGYSEMRSGLFVDQKWANLAPCFFESVHILKDPGVNMAYWNLHERALTGGEGRYLVNGQSPLRFFHFSGIDLEDESQLSRHSSRHQLSGRPDLVPLFRGYREQVLEMGYSSCKNRPYSFGSFSDGKPITQIVRSALAISEHNFPGDDPFSTQGNFYRWARSRGLVGSSDTGHEHSYATYQKAINRVRIANSFLSMLLRIAGPNRYTILMKYLSFISILRNQVGVLSPSMRDSTRNAEVMGSKVETR